MLTDPSNLEQTSPQNLLQTLLSINASLTELKFDFSSKMGDLASNTNRIEQVLERLNKRVVLVEEIPFAKEDRSEIRTPQTKIQENKLAKEIKVLKAEVFKLAEENASLRKYKFKQAKQDSKNRFKVNEFEGFKSDHADFSNDDFLNEIPISVRNRKVREFCLDSNPSQSFHGLKEFQPGYVSSKDNDSDGYSVRTSKGNANIHSGKINGPISRINNEFKFGFLNSNHFAPEKKLEVFSAKIERQISKKKDSIKSNDRVSGFDEPEIPRKEDSATSEQKKMSIKNVRNFCDFQLLLRDLKNSLNASIYSSFNDNIEENVQLLNSLLERYKTVDEQIEVMYRRVRDKRVVEDGKEDSRGADGSLDDSYWLRTQSNSPGEQARLIQLVELRKTSNFCLYENRLVQIQTNPSEFDSFLYTIKAELAKREQTFRELNQNGFELTR